MLETTRHNAMPSNRKFGALFAGIFALAATYGQFRGWGGKGQVLWGGAILLGAVALWFPGWLAPLNRAWFRLGQLLGKVVNPVVIGAMFFFIFTPIALLSRWLGHDELRLKRQAVDTYWINREPPGPAAESFERQY